MSRAEELIDQLVEYNLPKLPSWISSLVKTHKGTLTKANKRRGRWEFKFPGKSEASAFIDAVIEKEGFYAGPLPGSSGLAGGQVSVEPE